MWAFDIHIIDGLANRLGWLAAVGGSGLRRAQTGIVGNYALTIVAGLLVIRVAYGGYAAGGFTRGRATTSSRCSWAWPPAGCRRCSASTGAEGVVWGEG